MGERTTNSWIITHNTNFSVFKNFKMIFCYTVVISFFFQRNLNHPTRASCRSSMMPRGSPSSKAWIVHTVYMYMLYITEQFWTVTVQYHCNCFYYRNLPLFYHWYKFSKVFVFYFDVKFFKKLVLSLCLAFNGKWLIRVF